MMLKTTVGQILINRQLPPQLRDYNRPMGKKQVYALLDEVAARYPDKYRDIAHHLSNVGRAVAYETGGHSFGLEHLLPVPAVHESRMRLRRRMREIMAHKDWSGAKREAKIIEATAKEHQTLEKAILDEATQMDNPLAAQIRAGARGNPAGLKRLIGGDMLYLDHRDRVIPFPVTTSYSEGLSPAEYWAGTFGARKGLIATKFAVQDAGFLSKQLNQLAHRLLVTQVDDDKPSNNLRGMPVDVTDVDNAGALLASPVGEYDRNTVLTPKILADLKNHGIKRILVRSPIVGGPASGGVSARDVGIRERNRLPQLGDMVGATAAQALGEKITQGQLSAKHSGGVAGAGQSLSSFQRLNQLIQVPKTFKAGAAHAQTDGRVNRIDKAPAGGTYIWINEQRHFVSPGFTPTVKKGDEIEAGDLLSDGLPNPAEIVKHKGIGEGRRYFAREYVKAYRDSGMGVNRRNVELIARGLIDHVEMDDPLDDYLPGDLVSYSQLEHDWKQRPGTEVVTPKQAIGRYLEQPILHYTIGTRIQPSMLADFNDFGVKSMAVHRDAPPFTPRMVRAMAIASHDPDWMTRLIGSGQKRSLLSAVHTGGTSDIAGTSYAPALAQGVEFGKTWPKNVLRPPKP